AGAALWLAAQRLWPRAPIIGLFGLASVGLLACSVADWWPGWEYRTWMIGWAASGLAMAVAAWRRTIPPREEATGTPSWARQDAPAFGVGLVGVLVVLLALRAAAALDDHLWAAMAVTLLGLAATVLAGRYRQEAWAFAAGLGFNLAVTFIVWHSHARLPFAPWWVPAVPGKVITSTLVALLWLGLRPW